MEERALEDLFGGKTAGQELRVVLGCTLVKIDWSQYVEDHNYQESWT